MIFVTLSWIGVLWIWFQPDIRVRRICTIIIEVHIYTCTFNIIGDPKKMSYLTWSKNRLKKAVELSRKDLARSSVFESGPHY